MISVRGRCESDPGMSDKAEFDDAQHGGDVIASSAKRCDQRRADWQATCGQSSTVSFRFDLGGCVQGDAPSANAHVVVLEEVTRLNGTVEVEVPPAASNLDCYCVTQSRREWTNPLLGDSAGAALKQKSVAIAVMGELTRLDLSTTIASRVVQPLARAGWLVTVVLSLSPSKSRVPNMRASPGAYRFAKM